MILYPFFSFKTFYYFTKDVKTLDLSNFTLDDVDDDVEYTEDYFWGLFESDHLGLSKDLTIVNTSKGAFIYHYVSDKDYVREFLTSNSKIAPIGVFGSYRTSNVYMFGVADGGKLNRFVYSDDNGDIVEGRGTSYESKLALDLSVDSDGRLNNFLNENKVFDYAKAFAGFDIETENLEIIDVKFYSYNKNNNSSLDTPKNELLSKFSGVLPKNAKTLLMQNMFKYDVEDFGIFIAYSKDTGEVTIYSEIIQGEDRLPIYCETISSIFNKELFSKAYIRCIESLITFDLSVSHDTISSVNDYKYACKNKNYNIILVCIDTEKKFMMSAIPIQKKGKSIKMNFFNTMLNGIIMYDVNDFEVMNLYYYVKKKNKVG